MAQPTDLTFRVAVIDVTKYNDGRPDHVFGQIIGPYTTKGPATAAKNKEHNKSRDVHEFLLDADGKWLRDKHGYPMKKLVGRSTRTAVIQIATGWENIE